MTLAALLALALLLRCWGAAQGYPEFYGHVDEIGVAASVWHFFREGTLRPTEFTYPALYSYLVAAGIWLTAALGAADLPEGGALLERIAFVSYADPAWSALVGRALSALASTAAVAAVYRLAGQVGGQRSAVAAGLMMAVAAVPVAQAHNALPDSLASFLGAVVLYLSWRVYRVGGWREYLAAGGVSGLLLATKYNGALCALSVVAAHAARRVPVTPSPIGVARQVLAGWRLWACGAVAAITAAASSPYLVLAHEQYLAVARYQVSSLDFAMGQTSPWWWIPRGLVAGEYAIGGMMLGGLALAAARRDAFDWIALAALLPAFAYIGSWTRESLHYLLPYYGALAVSAARAVTAMQGRARGPTARWWAVGLAALVPSLWTAARGDRDLQRPDTRAQAAAWIEQQVPAGATLAMTWLPYCPRLSLLADRQAVLGHYEGRPRWRQALERRWRGHPAYRMVNLEVWLKEPLVPAPLQGAVDLSDPETRRVFSRGWRSLSGLRAEGVGHLVLPDAVFRRYLRQEDPPEAPAARFRFLANRDYFRGLLDDPAIERVAVFPGGSTGSRGGGISVFRLR